jgi:hypothetical protein
MLLGDTLKVVNAHITIEDIVILLDLDSGNSDWLDI